MITPAIFQTAAAALTLILAGPVLAQAAPAAGPPAADGRTVRDPFGDATVLRKDAESQAAARFAMLDADHDGSLSPAELAAMRPARAGAARPDRPRHEGTGSGGRGRMLDSDGDGKVTRDEFVAGMLRRFDMMDADHDGQLTKAERQAAMEAMRARMEQRMRERMEGGDGAMGAMSGGGD